MRETLPGIGLNQEVGLSRATSGDASLLTDSQRHTFGTVSDDAYSRAWNRKMIAASHYYKITVDGAVVGGLVVLRPGWDHFHLARIWVDPGHQGKGTGSRALALATARFPQATLWTAEVPVWARRCRRFFTRNGYRATGESHGMVRYERPQRGLLHLRSLPER